MNAAAHTANGWIHYTFFDGFLRNLSLGAGVYYTGERPFAEYTYSCCRGIRYNPIQNHLWLRPTPLFTDAMTATELRHSLITYPEIDVEMLQHQQQIRIGIDQIGHLHIALYFYL